VQGAAHGQKYTPRANRDLQQIPDEVARKRIREKLKQLDRDPTGPQHDVKKLQGVDDRWRLRVGSYRAIFAFDRKARDVIVVRISDRKNAY